MLVNVCVMSSPMMGSTPIEMGRWQMGRIATERWTKLAVGKAMDSLVDQYRD
jgi:hypothetical protein